MLRQLFGASPELIYPVLAMLLFLAMFVAVLVRVSQRARATEYRHMASLPLDDDSNGNTNP